MRFCRQVVLLLAPALLLVGCGAQGESYINTASLFELGASVRAIGMGGAFIAVADDDGAVFYNPAGLPQLETTLVSSLVTRPFGEYSYGAVSAAQAGWGAQLLILDSGSLEERDVYGNPTGTFRYTEAGFVIAGGVPAGVGVSLGLQAKVYALALPVRGRGASLSPALSFQEGPRTYALVWRNALRTGLVFAGEHEEPWLRDLAVGFSWRTENTVYALDFTEQLITRADVSCVRLGLESAQFHPLVLRAGTHREGSSFGASVHWGAFGLDLAYVLHHGLSGSYYMSFSYGWEEPLLEALVRPLSWLGGLLQ